MEIPVKPGLNGLKAGYAPASVLILPFSEEP